jgi:hypothetical protein
MKVLNGRKRVPSSRSLFTVGYRTGTHGQPTVLKSCSTWRNASVIEFVISILHADSLFIAGLVQVQVPVGCSHTGTLTNLIDARLGRSPSLC